MKNESEAWRILRSIFRTKPDLQPWYDYFEMLQSYIRHGHLEVLVGANEAYITGPALQTLACTDGIIEKIKTMKAERTDTPIRLAEVNMELLEAFKPVVHRINRYLNFLYINDEAFKAYAQAREQAPDETATPSSVNQASENINRMKDSGDIMRRYIKKEIFFLHVVGENRPHDLQFTMVLEKERHWWWPFKKKYSINVINYMS